MKEKILQYLKTKLTGVQGAYLEGVASQLATQITEESQIETVCNAGLISSLQFSAQFAQQEGDRRATTATETAVKSYEEKHKIKDGKPVEAPVPPTPPAPAQGEQLTAADIAKLVQAGVAEAIKPFQQKEQETARLTSIKSKVVEQLKDLGVPIPDVFYAGVKLDSDEAVESEVTRIVANATAYKQQLVDSGLFNVRPTQPIDTNKSVDELIKVHNGEGSTPENTVGVAKISIPK